MNKLMYASSEIFFSVFKTNLPQLPFNLDIFYPMTNNIDIYV